MPDDRIELDVLDGATELLGQDRQAGIMATRPSVDSDAYGPSSLSFQIARLPEMDNRDLLPETPIRYLRDGLLVFSGRITDALRSDDPGQHSISVTAQGWQFALDDDVFYVAWLLGRFDSWADLKNAVVVDLNAADPIGLYVEEGPISGGDVQISSGARGALGIAVPQGTQISQHQKVGTWMDARSYPSFQQVFIELYRSLQGQTPPLDLLLCGAPTPHFLSSSRVEYWRIHLTDLAAHHSQRIDPLVGLAPMPFLGLFIEHVPPDPPVGSITDREFDYSLTGPAVITDTPLDPDREMLVALVTVRDSTAGDTNAAPDFDFQTLETVRDGVRESAVVPPSSSWSQPVQSVTIAGVRMEIWTAAATDARGPTFDWTINTDTAGSDLAVTYWRIRDVVADWRKFEWHPGRTTGINGDTFLHMELTASPILANPVLLGAALWPSDESPTQVDDQGWLVTDQTDNQAAARYSVYRTDSEQPHPAGGPYTLVVDIYPSYVHGMTFSMQLDAPAQIDIWTALRDVKLLVTALRMSPVPEYLQDDGTSLLTVGQVVADVVKLCPQLDQDEGGIDVASGPVLDSFVADAQTPREMIDAANAVRGARVRVGADRRLALDDYPTAPAWQVSSAGTRLEGGGASSTGMANATLITGQDALGRPYVQKRGAYWALGAEATLLALTQADVAAGPDSWWDFSGPPPDGWDGALLGSRSQDAGPWTLSTPAPGARGEAQAVGYLKLGEGFQVGREYVLHLTASFESAASTEGVPLFARAYLYGRNYRVLSRETQIKAADISEYLWDLDFVAVDAWMHLYLVVGVRSTSPLAVPALNLHRIELGQVLDATLLDRRGERRTLSLQIDGEATQGKAGDLQSAALVDVSRIAFRGSLVCDAWSIQPLGGGPALEGASMLLQVGDMIRMLDELDPLTLTPGRDARIVAVSFDASTGQVTLELDATRHDLERVQAQLSVLP